MPIFSMTLRLGRLPRKVMATTSGRCKVFHAKSRQARALGRVAATPELPPELPADLGVGVRRNGGAYLVCERRHAEHSDEAAIGLQFDGLESVAELR